MIIKNYSDIYQIVVKRIISVLTDMTEILQLKKVKDFEERVKHMTISLPSIRIIPAENNLESLQKTIKNMAVITPNLIKTYPTVTEDTLQQLIKNMINTTISMTNACSIDNKEVLQDSVENMETIILIGTEIFAEIDWERFEPTDEEMIKANELLNNDNLNKLFFEEINKAKNKTDFNNSFKIVLLISMFLYHTIIFVSDTATITVKECINNQINPIIKSIKYKYQTKNIKSKKEALNQLNQELIKNVPTEITNLFIIVNKDNSNVYQLEAAHSKKIGELNFIETIQLIERKGKWTHISYQHPQNDEIVDGWILTKNLTKIN